MSVGDEPEPLGLPVSSLGQTSRRRTAAFEVLLCSGFPTQLLLVFALRLLGIGPIDASGELSLRWVVMLSLADATLLLGLVLFFLHRGGERPSDVFLGWRSPHRETLLGLLLLPVVLGLAIVGASLLHSAWPGIRNVPVNPFETFLRSPRDAGIFALVAVVAGGLREELQRAFIIQRFGQHLGGVWLGLLVFSVAFGIGHVAQGLDAAVLTTLLGALWGTIYITRRSVVAAIVSHAGFNISEILLTLAGTGGGTS